MKNIKEKLTSIVGIESVYDAPEVLAGYSRDESGAIPRRPSFAVKPKNVGQVQELVAWANENLTPLVPISSGPPHFRGDTVPTAADAVMVDLSGMKRIVRVDRRTRMALIESGVTFGELQPELAKHDLHLAMPLLPRSTKSVVASLLEREPTILPRFQWAALDPLRCMEVVFGDGNYMTTGEAGSLGPIEKEWTMHYAQQNPAGPAQTGFNKILSAAQGSMGIVTWASIKCQVLPECHKLFFVASNKLERLIDFAYLVMRFRFGDEVLFLNNADLAAILGHDPGEIASIAEKLPRWIFVVGAAGREVLPQLKVENLEKDFQEFAQQCGLELLNAVPGAGNVELLNILSKPSEEPYWKLRRKGGCEDIFFITTLDKTPGFVQKIYSLAESEGYPLADIGTYLQPVHQGASCHCEFNLPFDPENSSETSRIRRFAAKASEEFLKQGAFFSRPYGPWANMTFSRDAQSMIALRKLKGIFDPNSIMNPGKLCF